MTSAATPEIGGVISDSISVHSKTPGETVQNFHHTMSRKISYKDCCFSPSYLLGTAACLNDDLKPFIFKRIIRQKENLGDITFIRSLDIMRGKIRDYIG